MTYPELLQKAYRARQQYPDWRVGQAVFNVLYDEHPELANEIRGTALDPFYQDHISLDLLRHLVKKLGT